MMNRCRADSKGWLMKTGDYTQGPAHQMSPAQPYPGRSMQEDRTPISLPTNRRICGLKRAERKFSKVG
jgi:hypothetical protein